MNDYCRGVEIYFSMETYKRSIHLNALTNYLKCSFIDPIHQRRLVLVQEWKLIPKYWLISPGYRWDMSQFPQIPCQKRGQSEVGKPKSGLPRGLSFPVSFTSDNYLSPCPYHAPRCVNTALFTPLPDLSHPDTCPPHITQGKSFHPLISTPS